MHSQFGIGAPLSEAPQTSYPAPIPTTIRADLGVPVLEFETETDVDNSNLTDRLHYGNPKWFRLWEIAGSSHYDYYGLAIGPDDTGNGQGAVKNLAAMQNPTRTPVGGFNCAVPINTGGTHWALDAAVHWLNRWIIDGTPPPRDRSWRRPTSRRWSTNSTPTETSSGECELHKWTHRSPHWAAKATAGVSASFSAPRCRTSPAHLASLYKNHGQFVSAWARAIHKEQAAGFLLPADASELQRSAALSHIPQQAG